MSFLSDVFNFEKFNLEDLIKGIKDDPKRLLLGVDPASTEMWNGVLGKNDKPLVDQLGGPYGGQVVSVGNPSGGVYGRAQEAGINTKPGSIMQDIAHTIAAFFGGQGIAGAMPGGGGTGSTTGAPQVNPWQQGLQQGGQMLQQMSQAQQQPIQAPQMPQAQQPGGNATGALQLVLQMAQQARSEDELAEMLAQFGEPPTSVAPHMPQMGVGVQPQALPPARPGTVPSIPQTRGEALTSPSLGSLLG